MIGYTRDWKLQNFIVMIAAWRSRTEISMSAVGIVMPATEILTSVKRHDDVTTVAQFWQSEENMQ